MVASCLSFIYMFLSVFGYSYIDPQLISYVNNTKKIDEKININYSIVLSDSLKNVAHGRKEFGVCVQRAHFKIIKISRSLWNTLNKKEKQLLISHEILHCSFSISHQEGFSIMNKNKKVQEASFKNKGHESSVMEIISKIDRKEIKQKRPFDHTINEIKKNLRLN